MARKLDLHISTFGITRYQEGAKRITAYVSFRGNKRVYNVYYYDEDFDRISCQKGACCQSPTFASTEAGALRQIRKFFNS